MLTSNYTFDIKATRELLKDDSTYASVLFAIVLSFIQDDENQNLADIEIEELLQDLEEEFKCDIPEENENKINAAITAFTTDLFWQRFNVTKAITMAFEDGDIGGIAKGEDEEIEACPLLWATLEVGIINGMSFIESLGEFSTTVTNEINKILDSEAEDTEAEADELEEVSQDPYYHRYLSSNIVSLMGQFIKLGVPNDVTNELLQDFVSSVGQL